VLVSKQTVALRGGEVKQKNLELLTDLIRYICRCKLIQRLSFRALALRQSQSKNCGSYEVYILFGAAAVLKKKPENGKVKKQEEIS